MGNKKELKGKRFYQTELWQMQREVWKEEKQMGTMGGSDDWIKSLKRIRERGRKL